MTRTRRPFLKLFFTLVFLAFLGLIYLDARITATFEDKMWELPAKVYARPLELFEGAKLSPDDLSYELGILGYRSVSSARRPGEVSRSGARFDIYTRGFRFADEREPARGIRIEFSGKRVNRLQSGGRNVSLMRLDPVQIGGIYPQHGEDRLLVRLEDVPDTLVGALLATEDQNFYGHWGFSLRGIARAALSNVQSGRLVAGGSTITQQLVKNYYLTPERTITRKLVELVMAVLLELHYSKEQILESYLNEVYLGQDGPRAVHGFALAARHYFDTPLEQLGLHQQALLVGMIKGPSLYNPLRNPERAKKRRDLVLDLMVEQAVISKEHAVIARAMPLGLNTKPSIRNSSPAYLDLVRRQLRLEYRDEDLATQGLSIFTSFDPILQRQVERSSTDVLQQIDPQAELESATVVTRVDTGDVVAIVGGRRVRYAGFNRALDARRPAGSLIKSAVYLAALERPQQYSLATVLADTKVSEGLPNGQLWEPRNFDRQEHGDVLLHTALSHSYNLATARLGLELGLDSVVDMLRRLGVSGPIPEVPALTLGAGEYSPMAMAAMYQTIASGGFRMPLRSIRDIVDPGGDSLRRYTLAYDRTVGLQSTYLLNFALQEVVREGTGKGVYRYLGPDFAVAGKTGTTNNGRDSWFAGFSGDLLAVTWIGRDDNGSTGLTGSTGALRIWAHFMSRAARRPFNYQMPENVSTHYVDDLTGDLTGEGCPNSRMLPFLDGSEPSSRTSCSGRKRSVKDWFQSLFGGES